MDSQLNSGQQQQQQQQQQPNSTTSANADAADVVCLAADDLNPTFGTARAVRGVRPNPSSMMSSEVALSRQIIVDSSEVQQARDLGYALIVISVASIICQMISTVKEDYGLVAVGHGYWCGLVFMITGLVGIRAAEKVLRIVTAFYLLCILSAALSICMFGLSVVAADNLNNSFQMNMYHDVIISYVMQSLLATIAVAAGVVSVRGFFICHQAVQLCSSFGMPVEQHRQQQQVLQRPPQVLLQQPQPPPHTVSSQCPVVSMESSQGDATMIGTQQNSGRRQQQTSTTFANADLVYPAAAVDLKPTFGTACATGGYVVEYVGVQPYPSSMMSSEMTSSRHIFVDSYEVQQFRGLGYSFIVISVVSMLGQIISALKEDYLLVTVGHGYWCGFVFMISGIAGVWAAEKVRRVVTAFYILCIISAAFSICLFGLGVATAVVLSQCDHSGPCRVVIVTLQSLMATSAVAAGVVSVRGIFICRRVLQLSSSDTSAFGVLGSRHPCHLVSIEQQQRQQQQMLQPQPQFLLQQPQPLPQTVTAHCQAVFMKPSQEQSLFVTPMTVQASQQQTWFSPTLQPVQTAFGVVYVVFPPTASTTSSVGETGSSSVAAESKETTAPPPYPTAC